MAVVLPIPLASAEGRRALARMYIELTLAFHDSLYPPGEAPDEPDCNLVLVAVAAMLGHAQNPMTATEIEKLVHMPHASVMNRLNALITMGTFQRIGRRYYLEPHRAAKVPLLDRFELILNEGFKMLAPILSKSDK
jgi:hypothetical protein